MASAKQLSFPPTPPETPEKPGKQTNSLDDGSVSCFSWDRSNGEGHFRAEVGTESSPAYRRPSTRRPEIITAAHLQQGPTGLYPDISPVVIDLTHEDLEYRYVPMAEKALPSSFSSTHRLPLGRGEKANPTAQPLPETSRNRKRTLNIKKRPSKRPTRRTIKTTESTSKGQAINPTQVDERLAALLRKGLPETRREKMELGCNYIFLITLKRRGAPAKQLVKCGSTKRPTDERQKELKHPCKQKPEMLFNPDQKRVLLYKHIETLIHTELKGLQHKFSCECGKKHREFFEVPPKTALEVTHRWTYFCKLQPWDSQGRLRKFWDDRLELRSHCTKEDTHHDHKNRAERWKGFMTPSRLEVRTHNFWATLRWLRSLRLMFICVSQALLLAYLNLPGGWAVGYLWPVILIGLGLELFRRSKGDIWIRMPPEYSEPECLPTLQSPKGRAMEAQPLSPTALEMMSDICGDESCTKEGESDSDSDMDLDNVDC